MTVTGITGFSTFELVADGDYHNPNNSQNRKKNSATPDTETRPVTRMAITIGSTIAQNVSHTHLSTSAAKLDLPTILDLRNV